MGKGFYFFLRFMKRVPIATNTIIASHQNVAEFKMLNMPNSDAESTVFMAFSLIYSIIPPYGATNEPVITRRCFVVKRGVQVITVNRASDVG